MNSLFNHWHKSAARRIFALALGAALGACGGGGGNSGTATRTAPNPADQWTLIAPAQVDMDATILANGVAKLAADNQGISSMLVMRRAKPVLEQYWNGYDKDSLHDLRSATKSITSLMMGVAIDQRMVTGVGDSLSSHLAAFYPNAPAFKRGVTLGDLLTMRSGLDCDDWVDSSPGNESNMYKQTDWLKFYTSLEAVAAPATTTRYCTGNPVALGRVISAASKKPIPAFANEYLFGPLNIDSARWAMFDNGTQTDTGGHIQMRPRDMAKLGQLALQKGQWNGRQLVSAAWIEESTRKHTQFARTGRNGYGYLWWHSVESVNGKSHDMFYAAGNGGQYIMVVPSLELVVVFTGENYNSNRANYPFEVLHNTVLGAVK